MVPWVFGLVLIYFVALALIPNNAEAKDKSISKKKCDFSIGFHLPKDVGTPGPVCPSMSPRKKHNVMIVSAKDGHPVRDGKKSLRFELRDNSVCAAGRKTCSNEFYDYNWHLINSLE